MSRNRRGAGHNKFVSSFVQILTGNKTDSGGPAESVFRGMGDWVKRYFVTETTKHPCTTELESRMKATFDRFEDLARQNKRAFANDGLNKKATIAPVEFIAIAYIIDVYGNDKTNADFEKAIRRMRRDVRRVHADNVRRKQIVWKSLMESAQTILGEGRGTKRSTPDDNEDSEWHRRTRQRYGL